MKHPLIILSFLLTFSTLPATVVGWGDSLTIATHGEIRWTEYFQQFTGITTINKGIGGQTSTQIKDRMLAEPSLHQNFTVIWVGRNNSWQLDTVTSDIATMVAALGHDNYVVLGVINGANEGTGTWAHSVITTLNTALQGIYGSHYIDIRAILVALYDPALPQDVADYNADTVPASLRMDNIHLTRVGYYAVAQAIYSAYLRITLLNLTPDQLLLHALTNGTSTTPNGIPILPSSNGTLTHLPVTTTNNNTLSLTFTPVRPHLSYTVQQSTDLQTWTPLHTITGNTSLTANTLITTPTTINSPSNITTTPQQFLRLKITLPQQ